MASPELAMRALVADAFTDAVPVAQWMVVQMRTFLAAAAREVATEVMERDPEKRTELADTIVMVRPRCRLKGASRAGAREVRGRLTTEARQAPPAPGRARGAAGQ